MHLLTLYVCMKMRAYTNWNEKHWRLNQSTQELRQIERWNITFHFFTTFSKKNYFTDVALLSHRLIAWMNLAQILSRCSTKASFFYNIPTFFRIIFIWNAKVFFSKTNRRVKKNVMISLLKILIPTLRVWVGFIYLISPNFEQ